MSERIKNLENVKVGDVFLCNVGIYSQIYEPVTCTKVTPKQVEIGGRRYWKHNARCLSRGNNYSYFLYEATPEALKDYKIKQIRRKVENASLHTLSDDKIMKIWAVINGGENA